MYRFSSLKPWIVVFLARRLIRSLLCPLSTSRWLSRCSCLFLRSSQAALDFNVSWSRNSKSRLCFWHEYHIELPRFTGDRSTAMAVKKLRVRRGAPLALSQRGGKQKSPTNLRGEVLSWFTNYKSSFFSQYFAVNALGLWYVGCSGPSKSRIVFGICDQWLSVFPRASTRSRPLGMRLWWAELSPSWSRICLVHHGRNDPSRMENWDDPLHCPSCQWRR